MGNAIHTRQPGETFAGYSELEVKVCPVCGVLYAAPRRLFEKHQQNDGQWWCPNGHNLIFTESKSEKLERQLKSERDYAARLAAQRDQAQADAKAQKGRATRFKNDRDRIKTRVGGGVCPCCNRTFQQLARHMKSQHPDFDHEHGDGA